MAKGEVIENKFGVMTGWNNLTLNLFGRDIEAFTRISYKDEVDMKWVYGSGNTPIGMEEGNYAASAEISFYKEELMAMEAALPPGTRLQDADFFPIVVEYKYKNGVIVSDILHNCRFMDNGVEVENNKGKMEYRYKLMVSHIDWAFV